MDNLIFSSSLVCLPKGAEQGGLGALFRCGLEQQNGQLLCQHRCRLHFLPTGLPARNAPSLPSFNRQFHPPEGWMEKGG